VDPAISLSREDFLDEIRIAPKWNIFQYYQGGYFELLVFYGFGTWIYRSPSIQGMIDSEKKYFYKTLSEIVSTPSILEAKIQ